MSTISDMAVALGHVDYSETSQILVFFTREHGKVRAIAKGVRRGTKTRFAVGIDVLDTGRLVLGVRSEHSQSLATVMEWKQQRSHSGLRERLFRLNAALYMAEVSNRLTEDWDAHCDLFDALMFGLEGLTVLSTAEEALSAAVQFQMNLLRSIGLHPRFDECVFCGRVDELTHFSALEGGTVCRHCEPGQVEKMELSARTAEALRDGGGLTAATRGAFAVLNYHIAHLMGHQPLLAAKVLPSLQHRIIE